MLRRTGWLVLVFGTSVLQAQTVYWVKDHVYAGGKEVAIMTPAPADQTAPSAPSNLNASNTTATSVHLTWTGSTDTGGSLLAGYKIYKQKTPAGSNANLPVGTVGAGVTSFDDLHLQPSTVFRFSIVAFDKAQNQSATSNVVIVTTSSALGDSTAPSVPLNLQGRAITNHSVRLDWLAATDSGGSGIAGYEVFRDNVKISGANPVTTLYYVDSTTSANTSYVFKVRAVDNGIPANRSAFSNEVTVLTGN